MSRPAPLRDAMTALALCATGAMLVGCGTNRRTLVITSDPPGALVHVNDVQMGATPLEAEFTWFGVYEVRLSKPGYEPLVTTGKASPALHDQPFFDFFSEVAPGVRETTVRWHYVLTPTVEDDGSLLERARDARERLDTP